MIQKHWDRYIDSCSLLIQIRRVIPVALQGLLCWRSILKSSHCNAYHNRALYDEINMCQFFKRVADAWRHGPLARYVILWVAHAPGMPGTFPPPPPVSNPDMHHGICVTHMPWCMPGSLASGFLWSRWWGKRIRHSRRMHNPQFYVSGKRPTTGYQTWSRSSTLIAASLMLLW